ncbi:hypothetical protein AKJ09_06490 [Labilithrix luteola]|uniref:Uncharacterized protein n=1 Tax=Labilithrix luteola TaxID=1391654 RepID=A0A0K1Q2G0_9BACT|nr:hypothetical protein [Labilithrix luteola]AKU99826.1 hypothetical protein AKJ09_06490 [Labilithrix luteola]
MHDSWSSLVGNILTPARPRLEACLRAREEHVETRRVLGQRRAKRIAECEARLVAAREEVFAAHDGVVTARMTDLEREWRALARQDPDNGLMDLWARIAPASWLDRKRWRDSDRAAQLDSAIALASDAAAVDEAERAVDVLRSSLAESGMIIGRRTKWHPADQDYAGTVELLASPVARAREALATREGERMVVARAHRCAEEVSAVVLERFSDRQVLAGAVGHAAFVDHLWRAARLPERANPAAALHALWKTGYVLRTIEARDVVLAIPPL